MECLDNKYLREKLKWKVQSEEIFAWQNYTEQIETSNGIYVAVDVIASARNKTPIL